MDAGWGQIFHSPRRIDTAYDCIEATHGLCRRGPRAAAVRGEDREVTLRQLDEPALGPVIIFVSTPEAVDATPREPSTSRLGVTQPRRTPVLIGSLSYFASSLCARSRRSDPVVILRLASPRNVGRSIWPHVRVGLAPPASRRGRPRPADMPVMIDASRCLPVGRVVQLKEVAGDRIGRRVQVHPR